MKTKSAGYQLKEQEHFDRLAEDIGETWWGNRTPCAPWRMRRRADLLARQLAPAPDPLVLELGCGTGTFSQYLLERLPALRLVGCDISPKAVQLAAERCAGAANARFEVADVTAPTWEPGSFDAVVGCSVLHHLPLEATLRMCLQVLKPGGLFWFSEPNMLNPQIVVEKNVRFIGRMTQTTEDETAFVRWSLAKTLSQAGLVEVSVRPFDFLHPLVPRPFIRAVNFLGKVVEHIPLLKEISGSLLITARKPKDG